MKSGIYIIRCLVTGKCYVGSAIEWLKRIASHKRDLTNGKHINRHLQAAWNKYGPEAFIFELLEACEEEVLKEREEWWAISFQALSPDFGYNIAAIKRRTMPAPQFSATMKEYWASLSPDESAKRHAYKWTVKGRKLLRDNAIKQWGDAAFRASMPAKVSATMIEYCKDPSVREHPKAISRLYWAQPEAKLKMSARVTKQWAILSKTERRARSKIKPRPTTRFFTLKGVTKPLKLWSVESGLPYGLLLTRLTTGCLPENFFAPSRKYSTKETFAAEWL